MAITRDERQPAEPGSLPRSPKPVGANANELPGHPNPSRESLMGLDWFTFSVANVQTGFGPFISVYLTEQKWTQVSIGLVLTIGGLVALAAQIPGGALVDSVRSQRKAASVSLILISISALAFALWPSFPAVLAASVLHSAASCVLGPAMVAISLGLVGHAAISERLGRNARFASVGNGLAAAVMAGVGYFSPRGVFIVTVCLLIPAVLALRSIAAGEIDPERAHGAASRRVRKPP